MWWLNLGPRPRMQIQREHGPFLSWTLPLGCLAIHFYFILRNLWLFFTLSFITYTGNLGCNWWSLISFQPIDICSPVTTTGLAPVSISVSFLLGLGWRKVVSSLLKMCLLNFFLFHFLFPFHLKLQENNSIYLCYRPSSSLPPFTFPYLKNH